MPTAHALKLPPSGYRARRPLPGRARPGSRGEAVCRPVRRSSRRRSRRAPAATRSWLKSLTMVLFVISEWVLLVGNVLAQLYLI